MIKRRISYHWFYDMVYTAIIAILATSFLGITLQLIWYPGDSMLVPLLVVNGFIVPLTAFFIGLRPVLGLRTIPNTLYVDSRRRIYLNGTIEIKTEEIKQVDVLQVGSAQSHFFYYEISLNSLPDKLKSKLRKRSTLICSDRYNIKNAFGSKVLLIEELLSKGVDPEKVNWCDPSLKNKLGFRSKFKK